MRSYKTQNLEENAGSCCFELDRYKLCFRQPNKNLKGKKKLSRLLRLSFFNDIGTKKNGVGSQESVAWQKVLQNS